MVFAIARSILGGHVINTWMLLAMAMSVIRARKSSTLGMLSAVTWMSTIIGARHLSARRARIASTLGLRQSNTCSNAITGGRIGVDHATKASRTRIICGRWVFLVARVDLDKADSA